MAGTTPQQIFVTELTANDSAAKEPLGAIRYELDPTYGMRAYRYVQAASDTTVANGTALRYTDAYKFVASSDCDDASQTQVAGVGIGAITASYYGWIQCKGYHSDVLTDGGDDIADGDAVILDATVDGTVDSVAAGTAPTHPIVGIAVEADVDGDNTVAVQIDCI